MEPCDWNKKQLKSVRRNSKLQIRLQIAVGQGRKKLSNSYGKSGYLGEG